MKIKFVLSNQSIDLDKSLYVKKVDTVNEGGINWNDTIEKDHPSITVENYEKYIEDYYKNNRKELESKLEQIRDEWDSAREGFEKAASDVFEGFRPEDRDIEAIMLVFDFNIRILQFNTFTFFYKQPSLIQVVTHELMHFWFFEYCNKNLHDKVKDLNTDSGQYWSVSELFNVVVLNQPEFQKLSGEEEPGYPTLRKYINEATELYNQENSIDKFILGLFEIVPKN